MSLARHGFCAFMKTSDAIKLFNTHRQFRVGQSTIKGYDMILRQFCLFTRDIEIEHIREEHILQWFSLMESLGWDQNSFIPKGMALRKFFEYLSHKGIPCIDPWLIPVPQKQYKLPRIASDEGFKKLISAIPVKTNDPRHIRNLAIVNMLWDTGMRNGELMNVNVKDLQLDERKIVIKTEKSKGVRPIREVFWTERTHKPLLRWIEKRENLKNKFVFHEPDALFISIMNSGLNKKQGHRFNIKGVGEMLRRYANRAGIPYINAHAMRHNFGRSAAKQGLNNSTISSLLGHSSLQSSYVYTALYDKDLHEKHKEVRGK
jgi:site-specific recombinase XerD